MTPENSTSPGSPSHDPRSGRTTNHDAIVAPPGQRPARLAALDALRGGTLVAMVFYHLTWDLKYFGLITVDLVNSAAFHWIGHVIAAIFVSVAGLSLVLAHRRGFDAAGYFRRLALIVAAAVAVTVVTYYTMPEAFIFFGILHCIAAASIVGLAFLRAPVWLIVVAAVASILAPQVFHSDAFNSPALVWTGFGTIAPHTYDFRAFFPWFGVFLAGMAAARLGVADRLARRDAARQPWATLARAGRHSLAIYLIHQPLLYGALLLATQGLPRASYDEAPFLRFCHEQCAASGGQAPLCKSACACSVKGAKASGLWRNILEDRIDAEQEKILTEIAGRCRGDAERELGGR